VPTTGLSRSPFLVSVWGIENSRTEKGGMRAERPPFCGLVQKHVVAAIPVKYAAGGHRHRARLVRSRRNVAQNSPIRSRRTVSRAKKWEPREHMTTFGTKSTAAFGRLLVGALVAVIFEGLSPVATLAQDSNSQNISGTVSLDVSHAYFFRGIKKERQGFVGQPSGDLNFAIFRKQEAEGLHSVDFQFGLWNSLHTGPSGSGDGPATHVKTWYESDFFTGVTLGIDNWEAGIIYTSYMSPNDSFDSIQEIAFSLSIDDEDRFGRYSMQPHLLLAVEMNGEADGGSGEGVYFEIGVEPGMEILSGDASLSVPLTFGFSMSDYYENGDDLASTFGYFDVGIDFGYPLTMMALGYGDWEFSAGIHMLSLGDFLKAVNDGDGVQSVASFGMSVGF